MPRKYKPGPRVVPSSPWFHAHAHSHFSSLDAISKVGSMVDKAVAERQPALALTDHGNIGGAVQLYKGCKKAGILPFIGIEAYLLEPDATPEMLGEPVKRGKDKPAPLKRYHVGLLARNLDGYQALVRFTSLTHSRPRFNRFPRATLQDMMELSDAHSDDLILTTGCFFGLAQQTLIREGVPAARRIVEMYATWFPHTFVEIQNHDIEHDEDETLGIVHDNDIVDQMVEIADDLGLPVMATQDAHYCDQPQKEAHAQMKRMVYGGSEDEFPGDSFHLASTEWVQDHYDTDTWNKALQGAAHMLSLNELSIPGLDKFTAHVPQIAKAPDRQIQKLCDAALADYLNLTGRDHLLDTYEDRIAYELDVVQHLGMANYFLIWDNFVRWCKAKRICIEARGSANGSLVCFLLGITQVDPIMWDVDFDRFLSKDRIKPPDIDMDIEDRHRERAVQYLGRQFNVLRIGTWAELGARDEDDKGSVLVTYKSWLSRKLKAEGDEVRAKQVYSHVQTMSDVRQISQDDYRGLRKLADADAYKSYGVHAAGVLLSTKELPIADFIPRMLVASSDTTVSQYGQDDVEEWGLLKMDLLGQTTLSVMRACQAMIGREDPTDFSWIPINDPDACRILREGRTDNGIFHMEGYTKAKGGKEMGIKNTADAILCSALYMPGAMNTGQTEHYIRARRDVSFRKSVEYIHPIFEKHLKPTFGAYVYQNQVMAILRDLGFDIPSINVFLKVVKDSGKGAVERNRERMAPLITMWEEACDRHEIDEDVRDEAWASLCGFGAYGFNKAHATGYGIRSYRCAYLKAHYPLEFMSALLECWAGRDKEKVYAREARHLGIRILPPDVNISGPIWTLDRKRNAIRKGLVSIPGIGFNSADEIASNAPYTSIEDMIEKCGGRALTGGKDYLADGTMKGTLAALEGAGALDDLMGNENE